MAADAVTARVFPVNLVIDADPVAVAERVTFTRLIMDADPIAVAVNVTGNVEPPPPAGDLRIVTRVTAA